MFDFVKIRNREELEAYERTPASVHHGGIERSLIEENSGREQWYLHGWCLVCEVAAPFLVDRQYGAVERDGIWWPNFRERLECPACHMNNRQRAAFASLAHTTVLEKKRTPAKELVGAMRSAAIGGGAREAVSAVLRGETDVSFGRPDRIKIYLTEQVTPIYTFVRQSFHDITVVGSEFLGPDVPAGAMRDGIRHEDVEDLSFPDGVYDIVMSNDVLEHVNDPEAALREIARVLKPGGQALITFPFHRTMDESRRRAIVVNGVAAHVLPAEYHGNPMSEEGSLVFNDFGWDVLSLFEKAGFSDAYVEGYWSYAYGHLGGTQLSFRAVR